MPLENLDLKVQPYYQFSSDHKILYGVDSNTIRLCFLVKVWQTHAFAGHDFIRVLEITQEMESCVVRYKNVKEKSRPKLSLVFVFYINFRCWKTLKTRKSKTAHVSGAQNQKRLV